jgi:hypothetical protein
MDVRTEVEVVRGIGDFIRCRGTSDFDIWVSFGAVESNSVPY